MSNNPTWTILGLSNFFNEVKELIEVNGGQVTQVLLNQEYPAELLAIVPKKINMVNLVEFQPSTDFYAFGFTATNKSDFSNSIKKYGLNFPNLIHPTSTISKSATLGQGNLFLAGSVIASHVKMGNFNVVNRLASVGHTTILGDQNHLGPNATMCGMVKIGNQNFLGASSTVIDRVKIKNNIVVGAGAVVTKNLDLSGTYVGLPAKKLISS